VIGGALGLAVTYLIGHLFGTAIGSPPTADNTPIHAPPLSAHYRARHSRGHTARIVHGLAALQHRAAELVATARHRPLA